MYGAFRKSAPPRSLINLTDNRILEARAEAEGVPRTTISFYRYTSIADPVAFRDELYAGLFPVGVLGRIYVAPEGINAQISVPTARIEEFRSHLETMPGLQAMSWREAVEEGIAFIKLTIKVREKIVADGLAEGEINWEDPGIHVDAAEFNRLLSDPDTVTIDMRNFYESEVGHFQGAVLPDVETFRESLPVIAEDMKQYREKNVLMYCTGGIRCEKAGAYMKAKGYRNVFQLKGGIIRYFHEVKEKNLENRFIGKNFVFDRRLGERITPDVISHCHICGEKSDEHRNCANAECHILFIECPDCARRLNGCCSERCKRISGWSEDRQRRFRRKKSSVLREREWMRFRGPKAGGSAAS